jgi:hypothetical protein
VFPTLENAYEVYTGYMNRRWYTEEEIRDRCKNIDYDTWFQQLIDETFKSRIFKTDWVVVNIFEVKNSDGHNHDNVINEMIKI